MFVQVSWIEVHPGKIEQIKTIFQESVLPIIEKQDLLNSTCTQMKKTTQ